MATTFTLGWLQRSLVGAVMALSVTACASQERPVDWHDHDSYSGWVTDAATGKPLKGAIVVASWRIVQRRPMHSMSYLVIRVEETLTDAEGHFAFAPLGDYATPVGWERHGGFPGLFFFKPGYEMAFRQRFTWEHGEDAHIPRKDEAHPPRKIGWRREIPLYRYLTRPLSEIRARDPIYRGMTNEQKILGPLKNFAYSLEANVRDSDSEMAPNDSARRRKAIEAQWRAIVMIDDELRRNGAIHQWPAEIWNLLDKAKAKEGPR